MERKDLPLGIPSFSDLRQADLVYVDKTAILYELANCGGYYAFYRPRRFGKTLLLSTFESLFSHGLRDFKDLAIEKLWTETQTYSVIRLDFSSCNSFETLDEFEKQFDDTLYKAVIKSGIGMPPSSQEKKTYVQLCFGAFVQRLIKHQNNSLFCLLMNMMRR